MTPSVARAAANAAAPTIASDSGPALRWYAKKLARHAVAVASLAARAPQGGRVRALMYHRFGAARRDPFSVDLPVFRRQMRWLAAGRLPISLEDTVRAARGELTLDRDRVLVTIDDGWRSVANAAEVLAAERIPAVVFLSVDAIGGDAPPAPGGAERAVSWREIADLLGSGMTIGSHGLSHRSLTAVSPSALWREIGRSRRLLEDRLGVAVTSFAYPFGTRADYNTVVERALAASGYRCAFTAQHGAIGAGAALYALPRIKVEGGEGAWMFQRLCRGGLDPWAWIDRALWRWQARPA